MFTEYLFLGLTKGSSKDEDVEEGPMSDSWTLGSVGWEWTSEPGLLRDMKDSTSRVSILPPGGKNDEVSESGTTGV